MIIGAVATAAAQTPVMNVVLKDGTTQSFKVKNISELNFTEVEDIPTADEVAGTYTGKNSVTVGGQFTYTADISVSITANADGTVNFTWPQYSLSGTVMGNLTLGSYTVSNMAYDKDKGGFYKDYSNDGVTMHFVAVNNGTTTMDKDYELLPTSTILVKVTETGISVENPFKLGAMPLPISASFEGGR